MQIVGIRPLEWKYDGSIDAFASDTAFGRYMAYRKLDRTLMRDMFHWCRVNGEEGPFDDMDAAKAAALGDFQTKVMSCLTGFPVRYVERQPFDEIT